MTKSINDDLYLINTNGEIYKSSDNGDNWQYISNGPSGVVYSGWKRLIVDNLQNMYFADANTLYISTDEAISWNIDTIFSGTIHNLQNINDHVFVSTGSGAFYKYKSLEPGYTYNWSPGGETTSSIT